MAALEGIRVLDLTDARGEMAGRILADLGAEVMKIEPPGGTASRKLPPFDDNGNSLYWGCYGVGKKSLCIDLLTDEGTEALKELARGADILFESSDPGTMASRGLHHEALRELNPGLIYVSITPYGQEGPKANSPASSLVIEAAGGRISLQGDVDRPPIPIGFPQAYLHAGAQAAADALVALEERASSGLGQYLDLSMQEVMWWTLMSAQGTPICLGRNPPGSGDERGRPHRGRAQYFPHVAEASDGLVTVAVAASPAGKKNIIGFAMEEAMERGELEDDLKDIDAINWIRMLREEQISIEQLIRLMDHVRSWIKRRTKRELVDLGLAHDLRLAPLNTTEDLLTDPQFEAREFFREIDGVVHPGPWAKLFRTPLKIDSPAPAFNSGKRPDWGKRTLPVASEQRSGNAFEGLRVADFSWVAAGPTISKALADHGATVVKVESETRPDLSRTLAPHIDGESGLNRSYWSFLYATSKLSLQCDLANDEGQRVARRLCDWADVVIESFSPGTMARMGMDYERLNEGRGDLIMLSTAMLGQNGPLREYAGYGGQAAGFCGLHYITGWPDREPCGVHGPYTDVIAPKFGVAALAGAIHERRRSGKGQFIDLAQAECSLYFMAPLLLDQAVNGRTAERAGMHSMYSCPHGIFQCAGTQRYIAIEVETAEQWRALKKVAPLEAFDDEKYDSTSARHEVADRLLQTIGAWTTGMDPWELESRLIGAGVPASVVQRSMDVFNDPQIEARKLKQVLPHGECGDVIHYGFPTRFSAKEQMVLSAPPCLGEHNDYVLKELLGYSDAEIRRIVEAGAIN